MAPPARPQPLDLSKASNTSRPSPSLATALESPADGTLSPGTPGSYHTGYQTTSADGENIKNDPSDLIVTNASFRPGTLTTAKASSLGYPTENTFEDQSITSSASSDDLEKGMAPVLIQNQIGANEIEKSDMVSTVRARGHHTANPAHISNWRISGPPENLPKLPVKREWRIWRGIRHNYVTVYQRLFAICFAANMIGLVVLLATNRHSKPWGPDRGGVATGVAANVLAAFLIRQENVINTLYSICCATPWWFPLRLRRMIAKLYHFGGVHSGCAVSATAWFILFTALITKDYASEEYDQPGVMAVTYILVALFLSICFFAVPQFRFVSHNVFEAVHRFAGWISVALFWVLVLLVSKAKSELPGAESLGITVVKSAVFWILLVITFFTILPWLRLRKVEAFPEMLSNHAIRIHFKYMKIGAILGIRISDNPLKEWHAFASIPAPDGQSFSLIVSDAGDWTKKQIQQPSRAYWVRGIPITGVLRMAIVFRRVVLVTTGSGIGPILSMLVSHPLPCRLLWSTPDPEKTYGESIMESVCKADPDAMIINTRASGRPDMVALAYHLYVQSNAEAVFCISNPKLTRKIVYGMESRGIPAYGPIWDS
ncbi:MAG: hypothetical protein L6R38_005812 [Xanthoria sp. 2 TBL-2021]|nr:MAG: hypothetical protein L6R38_005812 [Xanthoria sp. 2 TBL-2021]